jgi:hypothetical protein
MEESTDDPNPRRRWLYAPFGLLLIWGVLGYVLWRDGPTPINKVFVAVVVLWSAYRIVTFVRRR